MSAKRAGAELMWQHVSRRLTFVPLSARRAVNAGHKSGEREARKPLCAASENGASRCANPVRQLKPESGCQ
eukprot:s854_g9.t1